MNKVLEIRRAIVAALRAVHPRVYYEDARDDAEYPYLVYTLSDSLRQDAVFENFVLDLDGWDAPANGDTTALETMMDAANGVLDGKALAVGGELAIHFELDNRLSLDDDDPRIKRRQYVYQARTFKRRG